MPFALLLGEHRAAQRRDMGAQPSPKLTILGTKFRDKVLRSGPRDVKNPALAGLFQAADGIRTHDLLHGKQTL